MSRQPFRKQTRHEHEGRPHFARAARFVLFPWMIRISYEFESSTAILLRRVNCGTGSATRIPFSHENDSMITIRRAKNRRHVKRDDQDLWLTFDALDPQDPFAHGFGALEILSENQLPPDAVVPLHPRDDAEVITYVAEGALAYENALGGSGVVEAGEFQRVTAGRRLRHSEASPPRTGGAHIFQLWLRPSQTDLEPSHEKRRFSTAQRRGVLCLIASPDGRNGTLHVHQDTFLYAATVDKGYHLVHELSPGRSAWLQIVRGSADCAGDILSSGDGAAITAERMVSFTAKEETEILLLDLREQLPGS